MPEDAVLCLMTDGIWEPVLSSDGQVALNLAPKWVEPPRIGDFLSQVSFRRVGDADDRTAVCIWLRCPEAPVSEEVVDAEPVADDVSA